MSRAAVPAQSRAPPQGVGFFCAVSLSGVAPCGRGRTISGGAPSFGSCSALLSVASTLTFTMA
eukprot:647937-Pyramimonas_sp.AAC.1